MGIKQDVLNTLELIYDLKLSHVLSLRVDLGVMSMKKYSTLPGDPELEFHHQMKISVIPMIPHLCVCV